MGRKSSAKAASAGSSQPPPSRPSSSKPLIIGAVLVAAIAVGVIAFWPGGEPASPGTTESSSAQTAPDQPAGAGKVGPIPQANLPPLPFDNTPPPRPVEVVRAAYQFAAEHPEVLSYVPCYCGCERQGHRGNDDCFVGSRDANGQVTSWDTHGMT